MKLFSWNVNGIRAVDSKGELDNFFNQFQPDVVGFQEIKAKEDQIDQTKFADYHKFYNPAERKGYAGTAIYSLVKPIKIIKNLPADLAKKYDLASDKYGDINQEGRVLTAEFDQFYFVTVYTPNSKGDLSRLELRDQKWDPAFLEFIKRLEEQKPVIFCGDLNVAHTEIDLKNHKANKGHHGFTIEERAGIDKIIKADLFDSFRHFNQETDHYTWWSYFRKARERNAGWRIDYFFLSNSLKSKLKSAEINDQQFGSDHCPISIEVEL